ncbi:MAG: thiamine phosphate synthase [Gammaproteobacteria bacterium]
MANKPLTGLYAITDSSQKRLAHQVKLALEGGARIIQYRDKSCEQGVRLKQAQELSSLCREYSAIFIINDDVELARTVAADGVHLGQDDQDIVGARTRLGSRAIIGISCYNQLPLAAAAQDAGADYVAFGRFFPSSSKPHAVQAEINLLTQAKQALHIPIVAIGGITPENSEQLIHAGADMLAVIQGLFGQQDVRATAERFTKIFAQNKDSSP